MVVKNKMMNKQDLLSQIAKTQPTLQGYGIESLAIFGTSHTNESSEKNSINISAKGSFYERTSGSFV